MCVIPGAAAQDNKCTGMHEILQNSIYVEIGMKACLWCNSYHVVEYWPKHPQDRHPCSCISYPVNYSANK
jgi:hypothetical protein